ncbi:hypothetical protein CYY_006977, partial [Polysphondylium violaceum]
MKIAYFTILILLSLLAIQINGIQFTDLTPAFKNSIYGYSFSGVANCGFEYIIKAESPTGTELVTPSGHEILVKTDTMSIYKISQQATGSGVFTMTFKDGLSVNQDYSLGYQCDAPPPSLGFQLLTPKMFVDYKYSPIGSPIVLFKMDNDRPIQSLSAVTTNAQFKPLTPKPIDQQHYFIEFILNDDFTLWNSAYPSSIDLTIKWDDTIKSQQYTLEPFQTATESSITFTQSIQTFPDFQSTMTNINTFIMKSDFTVDSDVNLYIKGIANKALLYQIENSPKMVLGNLTQPQFYIANDFAMSGSYNYNYFILKAGGFTHFTFPINHLPVPAVGIMSLTTMSLYAGLVRFQAQTTDYTILNGIIDFEMLAGNLNARYETKFPYGYGSGNGNSFLLSLDQFISNHIDGALAIYTLTSGNVILTTTMPDTTAPKLLSITQMLLPNSKSILFSFHITDDISGFYYFNTNGFELASFSNLAKGTLLDGFYEFTFNPEIHFFTSPKLYLCDRLSNCATFNLGYPMNANLETIELRQFSLKDTVDIYFDESSIDTQEQYVNNTLHMETAFADVNWVPQMFIEFNNKPTKMYPGHWDVDLSHYVIPFTVDKNFIDGELNYYFLDSSLTKVYGSNLKYIYSLASLPITSINGDEYGPIVLSIVRQPGASATMTGSESSISWEFKIKDHYNGFKSGFVEFTSSMDLAIYSFNFTTANLTSGNKFEGVYLFQVPIQEKCASQTFYLTMMELTDECDYVSTHTRRIRGERGFDPLLSFAGTYDTDTSIAVTCPSLTDTDFPELTSFLISKLQYDPFGNDKERTIVFDFDTTDSSGILLAAPPTIFLQDKTYTIIEKKATLVSDTATTAVYQCNMTIPYGLGVDGGVRVSIFGIRDVAGKFNGYSMSQMEENGLSGLISSLAITSAPLINSISEIKSAGGEITILGKEYQIGDTVVVTYLNSTTQSISPKFSTFSIILFDIGQVLDQNITVLVRTTDGVESNIITVVIPDAPPPTTPSPSQTPQITTPPPIVTPSPPTTPSPTPLPTNPPQKCLGEPACGGPDKGTCTAKGCVCISPWIGIDCTSKVLQIDQPKLNTTSPTLTLTSKPSSTNNNNNDEVFASIAIIGV